MIFKRKNKELRTNKTEHIGGSGAGMTNFFLNPKLSPGTNYIITDPKEEFLSSMPSFEGMKILIIADLHQYISAMIFKSRESLVLNRWKSEFCA